MGSPLPRGEAVAPITGQADKEERVQREGVVDKPMTPAGSSRTGPTKRSKGTNPVKELEKKQTLDDTCSRFKALNITKYYHRDKRYTPTHKSYQTT